MVRNLAAAVDDEAGRCCPPLPSGFKLKRRLSLGLNSPNSTWPYSRVCLTLLELIGCPGAGVNGAAAGDCGALYLHQPNKMDAPGRR